MPHEHIPSHIYLTGFMGCGKSTVGQIVAQLLNYQFVDLDVCVEESAQKTIVAIFKEEGEAAFRAREAAALGKSMLQRRVVVATGAGALLSHESLSLVQERGKIVFLKLSTEALAKRLYGALNRPLLLDSDDMILSERALVKRIEKLLAEREPFYMRADFAVETENLDSEEVAVMIVRTLNERA